MWYVVQTLTGQEENTRIAIGQAVEFEGRNLESSDSPRRFKPILEKCFVPRYQTMQKKGGELVACMETLFPGYLIVSTDRINDLASCIRRRLRSAQIIGSRSKSFIPLSKEEVAWIDAFTNGGTGVIEMSTGIVSTGDTIKVIEGPLIGREGWIRKINHRRKVAYLEMSAFGRTIQAEVGLRVVRKQPVSKRDK